MSEVIVFPPGTDALGGPVFGLTTVNPDGPVVLISELVGGVDPIIAFGSFGNDTIFAVDPNNPIEMELYGGGGDDYLASAAGNDVLDGEKGNDIAFGGLGDDDLFGSAGDDRLFGGAGRDYLDGGAGDDTLVGGDDRDTLVGGSGADVLRGGSGDDVFRFGKNSLSADPENLDKIMDFTPGVDVIQLSKKLLPGSGLKKGNLKGKDFEVVSDIGDAGEAKLIYEKSSGILFYNPGNGAEEVPLLQLRKTPDITASDIKIF